MYKNYYFYISKPTTLLQDDVGLIANPRWVYLCCNHKCAHLFFMEWRNILSERYFVSDAGEVKSVYANGKEKVLKSYITKFGYRRIQLRLDGNLKNIFVHVLVGMAFIENPDNKQFINHKNCVRSDNKVSNLEWATRSENNKYAFTHGAKKGKRFKPTCTRLTDQHALEIFHSTEKPKVIAAKYGIYWSTVYKIKKGDSWNAVTGVPKRSVLPKIS